MNAFQRALRNVALDRHFQVALLLGPVVWFLLGFLVPPAGRVTTLQIVAMVVFVYPVLEELAFRGFLQSWLFEKPCFARQSVPGISNANLLVSLVFAATHLWNQPPLWAAAVFVPSLVFGYFRDRYNQVWPSVILHCWYNAGFVFFFY